MDRELVQHNGNSPETSPLDFRRPEAYARFRSARRGRVRYRGLSLDRSRSIQTSALVIRASQVEISALRVADTLSSSAAITRVRQRSCDETLIWREHLNYP